MSWCRVHSGLVTRYYFLSESCCVVSVGRPLWQEIGSVSCQSLSTVFSPLSKFNLIYILHVSHVLCMYNIYKASVSKCSVQQIMPHHLQLTLQQQSRLFLLRGYASCCTCYQGCQWNRPLQRLFKMFYSYFYCSMFWPVWWPSSCESYKLFKATTPTTDPLCLVQILLCM
jgi:hypothetical protein